MNDSVEGSRNDLEAVRARLTQHAERLATLRSELASIRVTEVSEGGTITVVVDGNGAMVDLRLSPGISRMRASQFERALVATAATAAERAFGMQANLIETFNTT
ncbi:YbaB/EbfC family nucleoid-associated protein [Nocardia asiatica]|uniref:YbaB/EbfC family nucleoid-associated protein n=1 Tax=Nocardia asiatica TaxID=209252 RepID=UPI00245621A3|nr:YbaB/EbfC family nucleoid-associated protein [Nocardia asiatica]